MSTGSPPNAPISTSWSTMPAPFPAATSEQVDEARRRQASDLRRRAAIAQNEPLPIGPSENKIGASSLFATSAAKDGNPPRADPGAATKGQISSTSPSSPASG